MVNLTKEPKGVRPKVNDVIRFGEVFPGILNGNHFDGFARQKCTFVETCDNSAVCGGSFRENCDRGLVEGLCTANDLAGCTTPRLGTVDGNAAAGAEKCSYKGCAENTNLGYKRWDVDVATIPVNGKDVNHGDVVGNNQPGFMPFLIAKL